MNVILLILIKIVYIIFRLFRILIDVFTEKNCSICKILYLYDNFEKNTLL